jgi:hypothetical protein
MDKALVFGTKDCRFESCQGHFIRADFNKRAQVATVVPWAHVTMRLAVEISVTLSLPLSLSLSLANRNANEELILSLRSAWELRVLCIDLAKKLAPTHPSIIAWGSGCRFVPLRLGGGGGHGMRAEYPNQPDYSGLSSKSKVFL